MQYIWGLIYGHGRIVFAKWVSCSYDTNIYLNILIRNQAGFNEFVHNTSRGHHVATAYVHMI